VRVRERERVREQRPF